MRDDDSGHDTYDDAFWDFHGEADWDGLATIILRYCPARSVVDVGCGQGAVLEGFRRVDPALALMGYDGSPTARKRALARGLSVDQLDVVALSNPEAGTMARSNRGLRSGAVPRSRRAHSILAQWQAADDGGRGAAARVFRCGSESGRPASRQRTTHAVLGRPSFGPWPEPGAVRRRAEVRTAIAGAPAVVQREHSRVRAIDDTQ